MKMVTAEGKGEIGSNNHPLLSPPPKSSLPPSISSLVEHVRCIIVTWFRAFQGKITNLYLGFFFPLSS